MYVCIHTYIYIYIYVVVLLILISLLLPRALLFRLPSPWPSSGLLGGDAIPQNQGGTPETRLPEALRGNRGRGIGCVARLRACAWYSQALHLLLPIPRRPLQILFGQGRVGSEGKFTMSREIDPLRRSFRRRRSCTFTAVARLVPSGPTRARLSGGRAQKDANLDRGGRACGTGRCT